jgi:endonuclease/exonuclease/phosphatase family metal-dependent hydrolase
LDAALVRAVMSAGWRFSRDDGVWTRVGEPPEVPVALGRGLRLATLNCLKDGDNGELLQHELRQDAICRELVALGADVIGLNEVTRPMLERVLREEWVRDSYTVSAVPNDTRCCHVSALRPGNFGNVLLSKIPPVSTGYIDTPCGRESHVVSLWLCAEQGGTQPLRVDVCSTHLQAFPWLFEGQRKTQLESLTSAVRTGSDLCVVMGDFNFHREAENSSIPDGWCEVPAVVALGGTWDLERNAMLPHYLPLRNMYNGLGMGTGWGWPSPMRLDRVLVCSGHGEGGCASFDSGTARAQMFADHSIHERARTRAPLPRAGPELREAHRCLPWQEYLFPSDHFGILVELPLVFAE